MKLNAKDTISRNNLIRKENDRTGINETFCQLDVSTADREICNLREWVDQQVYQRCDMSILTISPSEIIVAQQTVPTVM